MKNIRLLFIVFILFVSCVFSQTIKTTLIVDGNSTKISSLERHGLLYSSAKELAESISGNYYYNKRASKVELKFKNYYLKVTARNQYYIIKSRSVNHQKIFQLPVSTILIKGDVFIPLIYSLPYLESASGSKFDYDPVKKNLIVKLNSKSSKNLLVDHNRKINSDYDIYDLEVSEKANGTLLRLKTSRKLIKYSSSISDGKLFIFLSGISIAPDLLKNFKPTGLLYKSNLKNVAGNYQLEFKLRRDYDIQESFIDEQTNDLIITIHNKLLAEEKPELNLNIDKWKFDVIVIDAGHGGKDGGAVGVAKTKEKDINLGIALKLGKLIENKLKDVKVVYTRKTDKFVELYKRGKIANENHGKLFISIHCNSLNKKPSSVNGYEIYLLRPGRTQEAIKISEFENSVIEFEDSQDKYKELTDDNFILVTMAHSGYMRHSEKFSDLLNQEFGRKTKLKSRGVKQAGFYVLVGASMPSVLIESGYLSNRKDEAYLKSSAGQNAIAQATFSSIKKYIESYSEVMEE